MMISVPFCELPDDSVKVLLVPFCYSSNSLSYSGSLLGIKCHSFFAATSVLNIFFALINI